MSIANWDCCSLSISPPWYEQLLHFAPFITAVIALGALIAAIIAICMQTRTARRRAAIDFFLKTDLDEKMLDELQDSELLTLGAA